MHKTIVQHKKERITTDLLFPGSKKDLENMTDTLYKSLRDRKGHLITISAKEKSKERAYNLLARRAHKTGADALVHVTEHVGPFENHSKIQGDVEVRGYAIKKCGKIEREKITTF